MSINLLAKDTLTEIINLSLPSIQENVNYCLVSKLWNQAADKEIVWRHISDREGINFIRKTDSTSKEILALIYPEKVGSNDEIIIRLQQFLDRCSIDKDCRFRCILGSGKGAHVLLVDIGSRDAVYLDLHYARHRRQIDMKEDCLCTINSLGNGNLTQFNPPSFPVPAPIFFHNFLGFRYLRDHSTVPDYSDPAKPKETTYFGMHFTTPDRAIVITYPEIDNFGRDPLSRQIQSMAFSKINEHIQTQILDNVKTKVMNNAAMLPLAAAVFLYYFGPQVRNYYSAPDGGQS